MATKGKTKAADLCRLTLAIRGESYSVRPVRPETVDMVRAWRIRKADGTTYDLADTADGATCTCGDFVYRHQGNDQLGCKHVRAARALGLLDPDGEDPRDWPAWTDTHAFTVSHGPAGVIRGKGQTVNR